jgi:Tol biopolymer transport system component
MMEFDMRRALFLGFGILAWAMPLDAHAARWTMQDLLSIPAMGEAPLSPDGKLIVFVRGGQIVTMPASGGEPTAVTHGPGGKAGLSWSPDGQTIAYVSDGNICIVPAAGGSSNCLTASGTPDAHLWGDHDPQWSPDSKHILFERGGIEKSGALMMVSRDGGNADYLVKPEENDIRPSWAPDGHAVSYTEITQKHFSGQLKLVAVEPNTGHAIGAPKVLYTVPADRGGWWQLRKASWSPDSKTLAIVLQTSGWDHVYLMAASGGPPKALTSGSFEDADPLFSPDGKSLAIISNRIAPERRDIWTVPLNGAPARALTDNNVPGVETFPQWSPDGQEIYFLRQSATDSNNLFVADVSGKATPRQLTNTLPKSLAGAFVEPKRVTYRSKDGRPVTAFIYEPRDMPDRRYPACHAAHK